MPLRSEARFASFLVYSPRGPSDLELKSREVRTAVKEDKGGVIELAARRILERWPVPELEEFLGTGALLVPVPRSAPLAVPEALWPSRRICEELIAKGLATDMIPYLVRHTAVPKAAFARAADRTKAQGHYDTMRVARDLLVPRHRTIVAVDDIVTSGSMLLASSSLLADAFPDSTVLAFGLVRTVDSVSQLIEPSAGRITLDLTTGQTKRRP